jgi:PTS system mannitol-specific IIA component
MTDNILTPENVVAEGSATTKDEAIREAGALLVAAGAVKPEYVDAMLEREASVSTYMGNFLAIPHGTNEAKDAITRSALSLVRYAAPIDWDGDEVRFAVGIAGLNNEHLEILSKIAIVFSDEDEVAKLIHAADANELFALLEEVNAE